MPQIVTVPGLGEVEFPDNMSQEEINTAIQAEYDRLDAERRQRLGPQARSFREITQIGEQLSRQVGLRETPEEKQRRLELQRRGGSQLRVPRAGVGLSRTLPTSEALGILGEEVVRSAKFAPLTIGSGLESTVEGVGQLGTEIGEGIGLLPAGAGEAKRQRDLERRRARQEAIIEAGASPTGVQVGEVVGTLGPQMIIPGAGLARTGSVVGRAGLSGLGGATAASIEPLEPGQSRLGRAAIGGVLGAALPGAPVAARAVRSRILPTQEDLARRVLEGIGDPETALKTAQEARELGIKITPAEASGKRAAKELEESLTGSPKAAGIMEEAIEMREGQIAGVIDDLLSSISARQGDADDLLIKTSNEIKDGYVKMRRDKAEPYYRVAYEEEVPEDVFQDLLQKPVVYEHFKKILRNPDQREALGIKVVKSPTTGKRIPDVNSVKSVGVFDEVTKSIKAEVRSDPANIGAAKTLSVLDKTLEDLSPNLKKAKSIYADESTVINEFDESILGKIAKLEDNNARLAITKILNPNESPERMEKIIKVVSKQDPDLIPLALRQRMEVLIDQKRTEGAIGPFVDAVGKGKEHKMIRNVLKNNPEQLKKFDSVIKVLKKLQSQPKFRNTIMRKSLSDEVRKGYSRRVMDWIDNVTTGKYDERMVEFIFSGEWDKELAKLIAKGPDKPSTMWKLIERLITVEGAAGLTSEE